MDWRVTIFADECAEDFASQAAFVAAEGLDGIDVRNANGRNCLDLTEADLEEIRASGLSVQCIGSPVSKVHLDPSLAEGERANLARAIAVAKALDCERIRVFSPEPDYEADAEVTWRAIEAWWEPKVALAAEAGVVLLHENDALYYGAHPEHSRRLFERFGSENFKAAYDFSNAVLIGHRWEEFWEFIVPHLDTLHIKDSVRESGEIKPAGEGEARIAEGIRALVDQGWHGTLTLEPHLKAAGPLGGYSGEELCRTAHWALRSVLEEVGA